MRTANEIGLVPLAQQVSTFASFNRSTPRGRSAKVQGAKEPHGVSLQSGGSFVAWGGEAAGWFLGTWSKFESFALGRSLSRYVFFALKEDRADV